MALLSCVHSQRFCLCISRGSGSTVMDEDEQHSHHRYGHSTPGCTVMVTKAYFTALPACFASVSSGQTSLCCFAATLRIQRQEAIGTNWNTEDAIGNQGNISLLRAWLSMWTGCSERSRNLPPWRYSEAVWTCVWQPALGIPAGKLASKGPFQPLPFCHSVTWSFPGASSNLEWGCWLNTYQTQELGSTVKSQSFNISRVCHFRSEHCPPSLLCETDEPCCCH